MLNNKIKKIMIDKNKKQTELAEYLKITKQEMNRKLNQNKFTLKDLVYICEAMNIKLVIKDYDIGEIEIRSFDI